LYKFLIQTPQSLLAVQQASEICNPQSDIRNQILFRLNEVYRVNKAESAATTRNILPM
jgi:hypothetical protein